MKRYVIVFASLVFLAGCGNQQHTQETPPKTVKSGQQYVAMGMEYLQKQDIPRAIQNFDMAIKQDPANPDNYMILGQVYMRLKLYNRAVDTFAAAVKVSPNSGEAHYLLSTAKALDGRLDGAVKSAQRSVELFVESKDEENFKKSVSLLKGLASESTMIQEQVSVPLGN